MRQLLMPQAQNPTPPPLKEAPRFSLSALVLLGIIGILTALLVMFGAFYQVSSESLEETAQNRITESTEQLSRRIEDFLGQADLQLNVMRTGLERGVWKSDSKDADFPTGIEAEFYAALVTHPDLCEMSLVLPIDSSLAQISVRQISAGILQSRLLKRKGAQLLLYSRQLRVEEPFHSAPWNRAVETQEEPTLHLTYKTLVSPEWKGNKLWSDLSYSQLDDALPERQRRIVVTVQQSLQSPPDAVLRVGLLTDRLDKEVREAAAMGHQTFICDKQGRLITRLEPGDRFEVTPNDDLRVEEGSPQPEVKDALVSLSKDMGQGGARLGVTLMERNQEYLAQGRLLNTPLDRDWWVVNVAKRSVYLGSLLNARKTFLLVGAVLMAIMALLGLLIWRLVTADLGRMVGETEKIKDFQFDSLPPAATFREVGQVLESLEGAKISLRALGKYAPIALVRQLYHMRMEPTLGAELRDVSILFTDIEGFTTLSEGMSPDRLAEMLGHYLRAMTDTVHAHSGTIDKYIGDAVMALWSVPVAVERHPYQLCLAALACIESCRQLYESPEWEGRAPLITRFGLHCDRVMVGHFGSPGRMSYTAMGDGVNLASRLEGLNKQYGTVILVSEPVVEQTRADFEFRLLDLVAVKGKSQGMRVFELLGIKGTVAADKLEVCRLYEEAFAAYSRRDFKQALAQLLLLGEDPPGQALARRCQVYQDDPPASDWNGVYQSKTK